MNFSPKRAADIAWYKIDVSGVVGNDPVASITCDRPTTSSTPGDLLRLDDTCVGNVYSMKLGGGLVDHTYPITLTITTEGDQTFERVVFLQVR